MAGADTYDVIVVGGGPSGSVMAWSLARRGVRVAVLERATFPRQKACGDFIGPDGLRVLQAMGALAQLDGPDRVRATIGRAYVGPELVYRGPVPYYQSVHGLPPHGLVIRREELDTVMIERARAASAHVVEGCMVGAVRRKGAFMCVDARVDSSVLSLTAPLVIGADGTESLVARDVGLRRGDRRHMSLFQRVYVDGLAVDPREATVWFDEDSYPGYGWMFPLSEERANVGVGIFSEACHRNHLSLPDVFAAGIARLRQRAPGCAGARLASRVMGGTVKTYGGIDRNSFDGGLLIGDAGSFVDPVTGEGISQGMDSALIASGTVLDALERGRFDAASLSRFDDEFRAYFDPSMLYLELCATILRNRHFRAFGSRVLMHGFEKAQSSPAFARAAGSAFGGLDVRPLEIAGRVLAASLARVAAGSPLAIVDLLAGRVGRSRGFTRDLDAWERGWRASLKDDAAWHWAWLGDLGRAAARLKPRLWAAPNPRLRGALPYSSPTPRPRASLCGPGDLSP